MAYDATKVQHPSGIPLAYQVSTHEDAYQVQVQIKGKWETQDGTYSAAGFGTAKEAYKYATADAARLRQAGYTARVIGA